MKYITIPTKCPYCDEETKIIKSESGVLNLICQNPQCIGLLSNKIDHYCGKKGLEIKGLSIKTIEKLIDWRWLNGIRDIYKLSRYKTDWVSKEGFGENSVGKILNSIEDSKKNVLLDAFISALGVPHIGRRVSKEITKYYSTWRDFREAIGGDWTEFEGFGPEISKALNNFNYTEADEIAELLNFKEFENKPSLETIPIDTVFCITGKLKQYYKNRDELKSYIESIGGKVVDHISSKVDYLINNDINSFSSKNIKAKELNIPIITEEKFIEKFSK